MKAIASRDNPAYKAMARLVASSSERRKTGLTVIEGKSIPYMYTKAMTEAMPADFVRAGIAHVPEGRQVFPSLTVMENLEMGAMTEAFAFRHGDVQDRDVRPVVVVERCERAME